jgi:hypothetical protein
MICGDWNRAARRLGATMAAPWRSKVASGRNGFLNLRMNRLGRYKRKVL